jgi:hypothetical protein
LNLKSLAFDDLEEVEKRYEIIEKEYRQCGPEFEKFLNYFEKNWIKGKKFKKILWNYSKGVNSVFFFISISFKSFLKYR